MKKESEENEMAFINDYLTEEEVERFKSYQLKNAPGCSNNHKILGTEKCFGKVLCTIDRERLMYLFDCGVNHRMWLDGLSEAQYFALVIENEKPCLAYFALVQRIGGLKERGCNVLWELENIDNRCKDKYSDDLLLDYLKQALHAYGLDGEPGACSRVVGFEF